MNPITSDYDRLMEDPATRRSLREEELIIEVTEALTQALHLRGLNQTVLANRLGKTRGFVSRLLNGSRNLTLRSIARMADALDCRVRVEFEPRELSALHSLPSWQATTALLATGMQEPSFLNVAYSAHSSGGLSTVFTSRFLLGGEPMNWGELRGAPAVVRVPAAGVQGMAA